MYLRSRSNKAVVRVGESDDKGGRSSSVNNGFFVVDLGFESLESEKRQPTDWLFESRFSHQMNTSDATCATHTHLSAG